MLKTRARTTYVKEYLNIVYVLHMQLGYLNIVSTYTHMKNSPQASQNDKHLPKNL